MEEYTKQALKDTYLALGGVMFSRMTGICLRNCSYLEDPTFGNVVLKMPIPKEFEHHLARVEVMINRAKDLYEISTFDHEGKVIQKYEDVYCDQLRDLFEEMTGLFTSLHPRV